MLADVSVALGTVVAFALDLWLDPRPGRAQ